MTFDEAKPFFRKEICVHWIDELEHHERSTSGLVRSISHHVGEIRYMMLDDGCGLAMDGIRAWHHPDDCPGLVGLK